MCHINALLCNGPTHKILFEQTEVSGNNMTECETVQRAGIVLQDSLIQIFLLFKWSKLSVIGKKTVTMLFSFNYNCLLQ